jgi:hypothetical protein
VRTFLFLVVAVSLSNSGAIGKGFRFPTETFAFNNNLYYDYQRDANGAITVRRRPKGAEPDFSRHCYEMARSVVQFYRFAEFRPDLSPVSENDYRTRIRALSRISPWAPVSKAKIIFPGYPDLHTFSRSHSLLIQKSLGLWWPSYWRIGNWRIVFPQSRAGQARFAAWLKQRIEERDVQTVFITRFIPINHCLVVYSYRAEANGDLLFSVYDCNQPDQLVHLRYRAADRSFYLDKTWYYSKQLVNVMSLYVSPIF